MITLFAFVGAIALLVVFHEFGHFWVARRCGVKVLRFSVGFGKVIYSRRFAGRDTEWVISAIPLGGYVKMVDEREGEVAPEDLPYAFNRQPVLRRMAIVAAGPLSNILLAIVLYWAMFVYGVPGLKPMVGEVPPGSPAAIAQLHEGETILGINGKAIPNWEELRWMLLELTLRQDPGQAAQNGEVRIEAQDASGARMFHLLDISSLEAKDLDGEFLDKLGLHPYRPPILPVIGKVAENSVAQRAGLQEGDHILQANGVAMRRWNEVVEVVRMYPGKTVQFEIGRGEKIMGITVVPQAVAESGKMVGKIGAAPQVDKAAWQALLTEVSYGPLEAFERSLRKTWETTIINLKMMGKMVLGEVSMKNISGPITIADYAGQSAEMGMAAYLGFLALISISLGVLNLLPIPLLDGGHLLYYVAELIKGGPVSEGAWEIGQKIGIALLGMLMVFAIYNDIYRLIAG
ncbi:RIP metalloprotease RseP [Candidatus Ferrigenium straubiae]|jgi:regulator of sigma E protease|uniref:RIP metalloprotease RseP n=1 Tax=Candidatus Ferrigenium straubiae TaxID=2919506 RepID=UPI003F4AA45A